jgi:hypothetical protein
VALVLQEGKKGEVFPNKACYTPSTCKKGEENPCSKKSNDYPRGTNGKTVAKVI